MTLDGGRSFYCAAREKACPQVTSLTESLAYCDPSYVTVVLEAPIGQTSDVWSLVQPMLAKRTRVSVPLLISLLH